MLERRAKIVCTLGPSSSSLEMIDSLVTRAEPLDREIEAMKAKARAAARR